MQTRKIIQVLTRRRDYLLDRLQNLDRSAGAYDMVNAEQRAIECAIPILEAELTRKHLAQMERAVDAEAA